MAEWESQVVGDAHPSQEELVPSFGRLLHLQVRSAPRDGDRVWSTPAERAGKQWGE